MMKKYTIFFLAIITGWSVNTQAQANIASQTMQSIYQNYDSIRYLSFDLKFNYSSDTLLGKFDDEEMEGTYTMAGKKAKYRLGDIDFMQNDSFFIAVYNNDKLILVDEPKAINTGSQLPLRNQIDSLLDAYAHHYTISVRNTSADTGMIELLRADSFAQFDRFSISYDSRSKVLYKVMYEYPEAASLDSAVLATLNGRSGSTDQPIQKKRLTISFSNYRFDNYDDDVYDVNNYIWFENGVCRPVTKYDDYKIYYSKPSSVYEQPLQQ